MLNNTDNLVGTSQDSRTVVPTIATIKNDMAMSYHFKVELYTDKDKKFNASPFNKNKVDQKNFLPVQNITFKVASLNTSATKIGLINDFPLPEGVNLPSMSLTIADNSNGDVEKQLRSWYNTCIPLGGGYIGYLDDMIGTLVYTSYNHAGVKNFTCELQVMLLGDLQYTRDYSTSDLKLMTLDLIILSETVNK